MREILYRRNNVILQYTILPSLDAQASINLKLLGPLRLIVAWCLFGARRLLIQGMVVCPDAL